MRAWALGDVDEGVEQGSVAGELEGLHGGGVGFVGGGVGGDAREVARRDRGAAKREEQAGGEKRYRRKRMTGL